MLRTLLALAVPLALSSPALAAEATLAEQYEAARHAFAGDLERGDHFSEYRRVVFDGVEGRWFPIGVLEAVESAEVDRLCTKAARIAIRDDFTLEMIRNEGQDTEFSTLFTYRAGSSFGQYTDAMKLLHFLGLDTRENRDELAPLSLAAQNGTVNITRPSPDILVIHLTNGSPEIYGRCP